MKAYFKIVITSLFLIAASMGCTKSVGKSTVPLTIVNTSKENIKELKVTLCDTTEIVGGIAAGATKDISMKFSGDCSYSAEVTFASGVHYEREQLGVVAPDPTYKDKFLVDAKSITFDRTVAIK